MQDFCGRPDGKKPLGRPRRGWEHNNKMDIQKWHERNIDMALDRDSWPELVTAAMKLWVA
jgi:hypothetical protein